MKNLLFIFTSLLVSQFSFANENANAELKIENLTTTNEAILYIGIANEIKVSNANSIKLTEANQPAKNITAENNVFVINVSSVGNIELEFYNNNVLIGKKKYKVERVPTLVLKLSSYTNGNSVNVAGVLKDPKVTVEYLNCGFKKFKFEIISYEFGVVAYQGDMSITKNNDKGCELTDRAKSMIASLKSKDKIFLDYVKVKDPQGNISSVPGMTITIE